MWLFVFFPFSIFSFHYEIGRGCTIYLMADEMKRKTYHKHGAKQSIKSPNGNTTIQLKYSIFYTFIVFFVVVVFQNIDKLLTPLLYLRSYLLYTKMSSVNDILIAIETYP